MSGKEFNRITLNRHWDDMGILNRFWRSEPANAAQQHPVRVRALTIEDDPEQMEFLCGLLRLQNVIVTRAGNIAGTLEILNDPSQQFELAFCDLNLPNGSGAEVVRRIKNSRRGLHVVVVSGDLTKLGTILSFGYVGLLWKPYTIQSIREILRAHRLPHND